MFRVTGAFDSTFNTFKYRLLVHSRSANRSSRSKVCGYNGKAPSNTNTKYISITQFEYHTIRCSSIPASRDSSNLKVYGSGKLCLKTEPFFNKKTDFSQVAVRKHSTISTNKATEEANKSTTRDMAGTSVRDSISSKGSPSIEQSEPAQDTPESNVGNSSSEREESVGRDELVLTEAAIKRLIDLSKQENSTQYLRVRVDSGGCYGFQYKMDLETKVEHDDVVLERGGAKVLVDKVSLGLIRGATIHWVDELIGHSFKIVANPNSSGGCGCGASFEIKF
ncbi:Iron-sulfur cluster assembly 2-like protein, mitochondrial [Smittium culicis]|uniref:Iron-sulfur cluster assembly 2-like protein, mitochondrial n=1 Tax=Smittium culicis TaxID=133412 RepID=A0A1R1XAM7_9FUNG|nr:Iron-sulfur cluster assembly 2-like protein, mitochondrial [Smittium culicis]